MFLLYIFLLMEPRLDVLHAEAVSLFNIAGCPVRAHFAHAKCDFLLFLFTFSQRRIKSMLLILYK